MPPIGQSYTTSMVTPSISPETAGIVIQQASPVVPEGEMEMYRKGGRIKKRVDAKLHKREMVVRGKAKRIAARGGQSAGDVQERTMGRKSKRMTGRSYGR